MGAAGSDLWLCSAESLHNWQRLQRKRVNVHFGPGRNVYAREKRAGRGKRGRGRWYLSQVVFSFRWIWAGRRWMAILLYVCLSACRSAYRLLSNKIRRGARMWRWKLGKRTIGSEYLDFLGSSPHLTSHHITSHHIISYHIISYHIISYHIYHITIGGEDGGRVSLPRSVGCSLVTPVPQPQCHPSPYVPKLAWLDPATTV